MVIEKYSHVMHIVSNVEGRLKEGVTNMDILAATFPAGTLSGAPKVRAMEIIEEVEPSKRGIYGGAVGVWGFNNDMDLAIAIRTAVVKTTRYTSKAAQVSSPTPTRPPNGRKRRIKPEQWSGRRRWCRKGWIGNNCINLNLEF